MTLEEVFQRAKHIYEGITLPQVVDYVNEAMRDNGIVTNYQEKEDVSYSAGQASIDIDTVYSSKVDAIEKILFYKNDKKYRLPEKNHRGNSLYFYELKDRNLFIRERTIESGQWTSPTKDLTLFIEAETLPDEITLNDVDTELPVDKRLHAAILQYVYHNVYVMKASQTRSMEAKQQAMYMSKYHTKEFHDKVAKSRRGNLDKKMRIVKPPKTTSIR